MKSKPTLYELLGVTPDASVAQIQEGFRRQQMALEKARAGLSPEEWKDRAQLLRVAYSTLSDVSARVGYDAKLRPAPPVPEVAAALALVPAVAGAASPQLQADALSLRADALALRADAMLIRAGADTRRSDDGMLRGILSGSASAMKIFTRAVGLLVIVGFTAFLFTRWLGGGGQAVASRTAAEARAHEKAALQEYYQTYGVRPANLAEMELLEAERRRRENEERQAQQDAQKRESEERRFEEEARRRGREVDEALRRAEERQRMDAERDRQAQEARQQQERYRQEQERHRAEMQQQQWRNVLRH
jgi:curved DNA-binding protein CbpA